MNNDIQTVISRLTHRNVSITVGSSGAPKSVTLAYLPHDSVKPTVESRRWKRYALLYLLRGSGRFIDHRGEETHLKPGILVQRPPNMTHDVYRNQDDEWLELAIAFSENVYRALVELEVINPNQTVYRPGLSHPILDALEAFRMQLETPMANTASVMIDLQCMLGKLFTSADAHPRPLNETIERACLIMRHGIDKSLNMPDVAAELNMGYHTFRKTFKHDVGVAPKEYYLRQKMERAQSLLLETDATIAQISDSLRFADATCFTRQFKRLTGVSPSSFRM